MNDNFILHTVNHHVVSQKNENGYINLSQLAEAIERDIDVWLNLQETKHQVENFKTYQSEQILPFITEVSDRSIWAHPEIAVQFALWREPALALVVSQWVRQWIDTTRQPLVERQLDHKKLIQELDDKRGALYQRLSEN